MKWLGRVSRVMTQVLISFLNTIFSFDSEAAYVRQIVRVVFGFCAYALLVVIDFDLEHFIKPFSEPTPANFIALAAFLLRPVVVLTLPYLIAKYTASVYLADIFQREGRDIKTAEKFIRQAAFGEGLDTITVRNGKILAESDDSPILLFGGPGYVQVELDSAIFTERPIRIEEGFDFSKLQAKISRKKPVEKSKDIYRVLGSSNTRVLLHDFERIRQVVDLREQPHSKEAKGLEASARTRDGLQVGAKDIKFVFSIRRRPIGKESETPDWPNRPDTAYPYSPLSIRRQVLDQVRVIDRNKPPDMAPHWRKPLPASISGLVISQMGSFIGRIDLGDFFAYIGYPELDRLMAQWKEVDDAVQNVVGGMPASVVRTMAPPAFISRERFTALFDEEAGFAQTAEKKGIEMRWIGVGTWVTPHPVILKKHLEAWEVSNENVRLRSQNYQNDHVNAHKRNELLRLIREAPIGTYAGFENREKQYEKLVKQLFQDYLERFERVLEIYTKSSETPPPTFEKTLGVLRKIQQEQNMRYHTFGE